MTLTLNHTINPAKTSSSTSISICLESARNRRVRSEVRSLPSRRGGLTRYFGSLSLVEHPEVVVDTTLAAVFVSFALPQPIEGKLSGGSPEIKKNPPNSFVVH